MMPKRGGRLRSFHHDHFEHDDRSTSHNANNKRRVSFKPSSGFKNTLGRAFREKLLDDDIDMRGLGGQMQQMKVSFRGGRGRHNSPVPRTHMQKRKFIPGILPWYQIIIPYGAKHEKDLIFKSLLSHISPDIFIPHYYKTNGNSATFFVDDEKIAEKLYYADRKIVMPDGFKLLVIVKNTMPNVTVDEGLKEKMKLGMAKRYNAVTKALDLTKFYEEPELSDSFCPLFRPHVMLTAIDIMAENIPDLEALNLSKNKINNIEHLKLLQTKLKHLKILYMGDNKIQHYTNFDALRGMPLVEMQLEGNPFIAKMKDHDTYVSEMRRRFPKLVRLDGVDLPPPIGFDVAEDAGLPPIQQSFLVDSSGHDLVREFLTQYYAIYDGESRQQLLEAYHDHASFSLACTYLTQDGRNVPTSRLNHYITNSRNLMKITDREARRRYLRFGRLQVVSFLSDLPKTKHDLLGFKVDLIVFTPRFVVLTVNGTFTETHIAGTPKRSFHRTFVIVPNTSGGFSIINDLLFVTNVTKEQEDAMSASTSKALPTPAAAPAMVSVPAPAPVVATLTAPVPSDAEKQVLLNMLAQQTGMNEHWSLNCLQETAWDLQRALFIFNQLHSEGKIPPEAFVK